MAKARGRGAVAALGFVLLFCGVVGGVVLFLLADREPDRVADGFARAAPGCRTTLSFAETGEFFVYEELSGVLIGDGCRPTTSPDQAFTWSFTGPDGFPVDAVEDTSISYDLDAGQGQSVARVTIEIAGDYEVEVRGNDPAVVAAIGGDPRENVGLLQLAASAVVLIGVVVGAALLWLSGRRSRTAALADRPLDPGWGVTEREHARRAGDATVAEVKPAPKSAPTALQVAGLDPAWAAPVSAPADRPAPETDPLPTRSPLGAAPVESAAPSEARVDEPATPEWPPAPPVVTEAAVPPLVVQEEAVPPPPTALQTALQAALHEEPPIDEPPSAGQQEWPPRAPDLASLVGTGAREPSDDTPPPAPDIPAPASPPWDGPGDGDAGGERSDSPPT